MDGRENESDLPSRNNLDMKHNSKFFYEMIQKAISLNCRIVQNGNTIKIFPSNKSLGLLTVHQTEKACHEIRRFLNRVEQNPN